MIINNSICRIRSTQNHGKYSQIASESKSRLSLNTRLSCYLSSTNQRRRPYPHISASSNGQLTSLVHRVNKSPLLQTLLYLWRKTIVVNILEKFSFSLWKMFFSLLFKNCRCWCYIRIPANDISGATLMVICKGFIS